MAAFQNSQGEDYLPGGYVRFNGVQYELTGKTRDKPVSQEFLQKLMAAVQATDPNLQVKIVSGGQSPKGSGGKRTGSVRHDVGPDGFASTADLVLVRNGKAIRPGDDKALYSRFLQNAAAAGFPGIGHYSWGVHVGGGKPATWGPSTTSRDLDPEFRKAVAAGRQSYASGVRLPYTDIPIAPRPMDIPQGIVDQRRAFAATNGTNSADRAIQDALMKWGGIEAGDIPDHLGYDANGFQPVSLPPARSAQQPMKLTASPTLDEHYAAVFGKPRDAAPGKQDRARPNVAPTYMSPSTPTQVASLYDGILPKAPVAASPKLSAPGAGLTVDQRNAMAAVPKVGSAPPAQRPTLQPKSPSNAPGQTWGVGGANQAGTTQMPRDVRPSSVPAAPALNPLLADAVAKYGVQPDAPRSPAVKLAAPGAGLTADQRSAMSSMSPPKAQAPAPVPLPRSAADAARTRVASLNGNGIPEVGTAPPMPRPRPTNPLPAAPLPAISAPVPLPRSAGDAARAKAAAQVPNLVPGMVAPTPLPRPPMLVNRNGYALDVLPTDQRKWPAAPVTEYSATLKPTKAPDAWQSMLTGVDEWWQRTPAGRIGNVIAGKPQAPSRTGVPEAFMSWLDQQNKAKAPPAQAPARKQPAFFGLLGNGGLFGGGLFGGGQRTAIAGPSVPQFYSNGVANPDYRNYATVYQSEGGGLMPANAYGGNGGGGFTDSLGGTYYDRHVGK